MKNKRLVKGLNVAMAVLFLLLLAAHFYCMGKVEDSYRNYDNIWPSVEVFLVRPLLGFCTGYVLMFGLFYLLKARIDMVESGGRHIVRRVMAAATVLLLAVLLCFAGTILLSLVNLGIFSFNSPHFYMWLYRLCLASWLWVLLGVYWFVSLNVNRVAALGSEDDDFAENELA